MPAKDFVDGLRIQLALIFCLRNGDEVLPTHGLNEFVL